MMRTSSLLLAPFVLLLGCSDTPTSVEPATDASPQLSRTAPPGKGGALGVVYVRSQGLYYDTFVSASSLPPKGRFQKLEAGETDFGPGDPGYLGGRWWVDDGDGVFEPDEDTFLLCPLLPPGRTTP